MKRITVCLYILAAIAAAASCSNKDKELKIADQEASIDSYIANNFSDSKVVHRNGSNRVILDSTVLSLTDSLVYGDSLQVSASRTLTTP